MKIYRQIPKLIDCICPICKKRITQNTNAKFFLFNINTKLRFVTNSKLPFCETCEIHYITKNDYLKICNKNQNSYPIVFDISRSIKKEELDKRMMSFPNDNNLETILDLSWFRGKAESSQKTTNNKSSSLPNTLLFKLKKYKHIYLINQIPEKCPVCKNSFANYEMQGKKGVEYKGFSCGDHYFLFYNKKLKATLNLLNSSNDVTLHFDYCVNNYTELVNLLNENPNHIFMIILKSESKYLTLIFSNYSKVDEEYEVLDYKDGKTRELLTEIFERGNREIKYKDSVYSLVYIVNKDANKSKRPDYIVSDIVLKSDGGIRTAKNNNEIVDVLLYSPRTRKYELMKVTCLTKESGEKIFYKDPILFRRFIERYGAPDIKFWVAKTPSYRELYYYDDYDYDYDDWGYDYIGNLNEESIMHMFGYNVNKSTNISAEERQGIIAFLIEMKIMDSKKIVNFLNTLITLNKSKMNMMTAVSKWKTDMDFASEYKANPSRFMIANK